MGTFVQRAEDSTTRAVPWMTVYWVVYLYGNNCQLRCGVSTTFTGLVRVCVCVCCMHILCRS